MPCWEVNASVSLGFWSITQQLSSHLQWGISPIRGAWIRAILMAYGERGNGKQTHHHTIDCQQQQNQQDSCNILMGDFGNMMNITPNARSDQWEIYNLLAYNKWYPIYLVRHQIWHVKMKGTVILEDAVSMQMYYNDWHALESKTICQEGQTSITA